MPRRQGIWSARRVTRPPPDHRLEEGLRFVSKDRACPGDAGADGDILEPGGEAFFDKEFRRRRRQFGRAALRRFLREERRNRAWYVNDQ